MPPDPGTEKSEAKLKLMISAVALTETADADIRVVAAFIMESRRQLMLMMLVVAAAPRNNLPS